MWRESAPWQELKCVFLWHQRVVPAPDVRWSFARDDEVLIFKLHFSRARRKEDIRLKCLQSEKIESSFNYENQNSRCHRAGLARALNPQPSTRNLFCPGQPHAAGCARANDEVAGSN